jgi:hypothetical protein
MTATPAGPATPSSHAPSRRTVLRTAAWSVPAVSVSVAVPAYAACSPASATTTSYMLNWGTGLYTRSSAESGSASVPGRGVGAQPVNVFVTSKVSGDVRLTSENLAESAHGLELHHASRVTAGRSNRQTVTFTFSRPVSGLAFTIKDVDSQSRGWYDQVELSGSRDFAVNERIVHWFGFPIRVGDFVEGAGTSDSPWHFYNSNTVVANTGDNRGDIRVTYKEPVTTIALDYWTSVGGSNQRIWLSDFSFTASSC